MSLGFDSDLLYEKRQAASNRPVRKTTRLTENRKLHYRTSFQDLPISVENRRGSVRVGTDPDGEEWRTKMKVPYGYIPGTEGADGDAVDTFVGSHEDAAYAYVVHANNPESGKYDEDKVMLGFKSAADAKQCFMQHYDDPKFFGGMDSIPMWKFRDKVWVKKHTAKRLVASMRDRFLESAGGDWVKVPITLLIKVVAGEVSDKADDGSSDGEKQRKEVFTPAGYFASTSLTGEDKPLTKGKKRGPFGEAYEPTRTKETYGFSSKSLVHEPTGHGGASHIFTSIRETTEHGTPGMKWGARQAIEKAGGVYRGAQDHPTKGKIHMFDDPGAKHKSTLAMYEKDIKSPEDVKARMDEKRKQFGEAREHGIQGMKWGSKDREELAMKKASNEELAQALRSETSNLRDKLNSGRGNPDQREQIRARIDQNTKLISHYEK